jgi:hypothetical protein
MVKKVIPASKQRTDIKINTDPAEGMVLESPEVKGISYQAYMAIDRFSICVTHATTGKLRPANLMDVLDAIQPVRLAINTANEEDDTVKIITSGRVSNSEWMWTPRQPIWVGNEGVLTQAQPAYPNAEWTKMVAVAETVHTIILTNLEPLYLDG